MSDAGSAQSTCIRRSRHRQPLSELALVLTAVSIEHDIAFDGHDWCLWVGSADVQSANEELTKYARENEPSRRRYREAHTVDSGILGVLGYLVVIWALPTLEAEQAFGWEWRSSGAMDAAMVRAGEWWRTVTALTLHGDLAHLVANSLFGAVFGLFVGRYLGSGLGWLLVLAAGASGNAINAFIQSDGFRSVGASTATFASLALVGAFVWRRGYLKGWDWRRRFAPVFGGIALLAYTGFGGGNTDVMAHVTGFGCGLLLGLVVGGIDVRRLGTSGQLICATAAVVVVVRAWTLAGAAA